MSKKSIKHKVHSNKDKPKSSATKKTEDLKLKLKTPNEIAMDFAAKVHKKFADIVKATILFGSQAKGEAVSGSDIDIVIIIDDASINWDMELTAWYREELRKLIEAQNYGRELHINTVRLSTWWRDLFHGDAVVINILRNGQALIDLAGFFNPLKALLLQGNIHSTPEAVYSALQRAPRHLARSKIAILNSIEGVYWCMVESAQAAIITLGKIPPSPEHITKMLKETFVDSKVLKLDYVLWYRDIYAMHKSISHGELKEVKGFEIDQWQDRAEQFMKKMAEIIDQLIDAKKAQDGQ